MPRTKAKSKSKRVKIKVPKKSVPKQKISDHIAEKELKKKVISNIHLQPRKNTNETQNKGTKDIPLKSNLIPKNPIENKTIRRLFEKQNEYNYHETNIKNAIDLLIREYFHDDDEIELLLDLNKRDEIPKELLIIYINNLNNIQTINSLRYFIDEHNMKHVVNKGSWEDMQAKRLFYFVNTEKRILSWIEQYNNLILRIKNNYGQYDEPIMEDDDYVESSVRIVPQAEEPLTGLNEITPANPDLRSPDGGTLVGCGRVLEHIYKKLNNKRITKDQLNHIHRTLDKINNNYLT